MNRRITVLGLGAVLTVAGLAGCAQAGAPSSGMGTPATGASTVATNHPPASPSPNAGTGGNGAGPGTASGAGDGTGSGSDGGSGNGGAGPTPATSGPQPAPGSQAPNYGHAPVAPHPLRISPAASADLTIGGVRFAKFAVNSDECLFSFTLLNRGPGTAYELTFDLTVTGYVPVAGYPPAQYTSPYSDLPGPTSLARGSSYQGQLDNRTWLPGQYAVTINAKGANGNATWQGVATC